MKLDKDKLNLANVITASRILFSILLLFVPPLSVPFAILYGLCGLSDAVDGTVARKMNTVSDFGAKLDTIADVFFVAASILKLYEILAFPIWIWIWIVMIAGVKITNFVIGFVKYKRMVTQHTVLNKVTGVVLFLYPLSLFTMKPILFAVAVCVVATIAALQEIKLTTEQ